MKKLEKVAANVVRKVAEVNACRTTCLFFFHQPKVTEELKRKLREKK